MQRRAWIAVVVGALVGAGGAAGFGPCVRAQVESKAASYGARVEVERVVPGLRGVRLRGVDVVSDELPGVTAHVDEVVVGWTGGSAVELGGGRVRAIGSLSELLSRLERWRARHAGGSSGGGGGRPLRLEGLEVDWQEHDGDPSRSLSAKGVSVARAGAALRLGAAELRGQLDRTTVQAAEARVVLAREQGGYQLTELASRSLSLEVLLEGAVGGTPAQPAALPSAAPASPAAGAGTTDRVAKARMARQLAVELAERARGLLAPDAKTSLEAVRCRLRWSGEELNLGPGTLGFEREEQASIVVLAPGGEAAANAGDGGPQRITFTLRIPTAGVGGPLVAELHGGPVWLSTLGIKDGDLGLRDVAQASLEADARVELPEDGRLLRVDGRGKLRSVALASPRLASQPLTGIELGWRAKAELSLDATRLDVAEGAVDFGDIHASFSGRYEHVGDAHRLDARYEVPLVTCQQAFDSLPKALVPELAGMRFAGSLGIKGTARFDTARLDQTYAVVWDATNSCRVSDVPQRLSAERFRKPFERTVRGPDGKEAQLTFGPGSATWTPLAAISPYMQDAVLTTEDGHFERHRGFDEEAIVNSIRENLRAGRFVRGASTISMQAARNLYLGRERTIARKLQEAILTLYLEQELTKREIMELYLNVIEFGPMIYGVGPAARHYFNSGPSQLSLGQALYLSSILPNPNKQYFGAGGAVSPGWMKHLRLLMKIVHKTKRITDAELEEALRETVVLGSPSPMRAPSESGAADGEGGAGPGLEPWQGGDD